ncbi:MAG: hypothetical protein KC910_05350 [Candidatus Eremiobacteraeota bacterium]|nr:hypothetical protein [Candidatus Eremiobacteraeota bacterium]
MHRLLTQARKVLRRLPHYVPLVGLSLAVVVVVLNAALLLVSWPWALVAAGSSAVAVVVNSPSDEDQRDFSRAELVFLTVGCLVVGAYALSWYWQRLPFDFWLDFPQQALLYENGLPATHPYFEQVPMGGQYGRNLLVAGLARATGQPVLTTAIISNVLFQVLLFCQVFVVFTQSDERAGFMAPPLLFLGLGVGGWCGLLDHFFHHAALAHLLLFVGWYWVRRGSGLAIWALLAQGLVFPLYVCLLVPVWLWGQQLNRKTVGALILLAVALPLQGGPLRQLVTPSAQLSPEQASQQQRFSVRFPKQQLFRIYVQPWVYWRTSLALTNIPQLGYSSDYRPRHYASILSREVLSLHWLPLWLAPLTFWLAEGEARRWWCFGLLAYLTPALIDFGPVYECEYYRWELAAGVGFGACLALVLARHRWGWLVLALACWPGLYRLAHIDYRLQWPEPAVWCQRHQPQLRLRRGELALCAQVRRLSAPGDILWRDSMPDQEDDDAIEGDAVVAGLCRRRLTGRAFPLLGDYVGRPPFRPTLNARAFWALKDPAAVWESNVDWLIASKQADFSQCARKVAEEGDVCLWQVGPPAYPPAAAGFGTPPERLEIPAYTVKLDRSWCPPFEGVLRQRWTRQTSDFSWTSAPVYQSSHDGLLVSAPVYPGDYQLHLSSGQTLKVRVLPLTDLGRLKIVECRAHSGSVEVELENQGEAQLRLTNVRFSVLPCSDEGVYGIPTARHHLPALVLGPGARLTLKLQGSLPEQGGLNIEANELARLLPLK